MPYNLAGKEGPSLWIGSLLGVAVTLLQTVDANPNVKLVVGLVFVLAIVALLRSAWRTNPDGTSAREPWDDKLMKKP
jgi:hypothetical protein